MHHGHARAPTRGHTARPHEVTPTRERTRWTTGSFFSASKLNQNSHIALLPQEKACVTQTRSVHSQRDFNPHSPPCEGGATDHSKKAGSTCFPSLFTAHSTFTVSFWECTALMGHADIRLEHGDRQGYIEKNHSNALFCMAVMR